MRLNKRFCFVCSIQADEKTQFKIVQRSGFNMLDPFQSPPHTLLIRVDMTNDGHCLPYAEAHISAFGDGPADAKTEDEEALQ